MNRTYGDCYVSWDEDGFIIGNSAIERRYALGGNSIVPGQITSKLTGGVWGEGASSTVVDSGAYGRADFRSLAFEAGTDDHHGLSGTYLYLSATFDYADSTVIRTYSIFPQLPFIATSSRVKGRAAQRGGEGGEAAEMNGVESGYRLADERLVFSARDVIDIIPLARRHLKMEAVRLYDKTDRYDTLVLAEKQSLYPRGTYRGEGNLFFIEDYAAGETLLIVKDAPTHTSALARADVDIEVHGNRYAELIGSGLGSADHDGFVQGYGSVCGVGSSDEIKRLYKAYYGMVYRGDPRRELFIMSNTWGDRNQDSAVSRDFILEELRIAGELGIDVMQIDDGWEQGITANSKLVKGGVWEGYYAYDKDFWEVNAKKFPGGFGEIAGAARESGVRLGLWFSPDCSDDIANWRLDVDNLLRLHGAFGVEFFKLDGIKVRSKRGERNLFSLLSALASEGGGRIAVNLDITAEDRLGYLYGAEYGTLFVENRYTDWGNYYPHSTMRNLWMLAGYFPARKFQFELLNNARNQHMYPDDPFAPALYSIDYTFAAVMVSNPLVWMELSGLSAENRALLRGVIAVYKAHRAAFSDAEVVPVGDAPDGQSFTGFQVIVGPASGYLILFRENTHAAEYAYVLRVPPGSRLDVELLYSNRPADAFDFEGEAKGGYLVRMAEPRSFVFLRYTAR